MTTDNKIFLLIVLPLIIVFFFLYSILSITTPKRFTSPDENINLFYSKLYSTTGKLSYYEPLAELSLGYARPRNTTLVHNYVVPSTFVGFYVLVGTFVSVIPEIIFYITPFLAVLGGLFLFILTKTVFNQKVAILSLIILLVSTPYWYWSSMVLYGNIAATVLLVGGVTFFFSAIKEKKLGYYLVCALLFGVGQLVRLTDITYFIPFAILIILLRKEIVIKYFLLSLLVYIFAIIPQFIMNINLYGNIMSFGYTNNVVQSGIKPSLLVAFVNKITFFLLPSGVRLSNIIYSISTYLIKLSPIYFILGILGIVFNLRKNFVIAQKYTIYFIFLSIWIVIYYGSGIFWGLNQFSVDASYIRYFLPIYILIVPLIASFIYNLPKKIFVFILIIIVVSSTINIFYLSGGFRDISNSRHVAQIQANRILEITESNSIIITTFSDKFLFPDRKIISFGPVLNDFITNKLIFNYKTLASIIENVYKVNNKVYVLNDRNDLNIETVNRLLSTDKLTLKLVMNSNYIYKVIKKTNE